MTEEPTSGYGEEPGSPPRNLYDTILRIVQDAQAAGSVVQIITIWPPGSGEGAAPQVMFASCDPAQPDAALCDPAQPKPKECDPAQPKPKECDPAQPKPKECDPAQPDDKKKKPKA
jgi:hypothetical protein